MKIVKTRVCPVQEKFLVTRKELSSILIERDGEVDLVLAALVAREHVLLVGPPGCGKSLLLDGVMNWMHGKRFSILLTKFTCPEEVVGPISIAALKEDRYRRVTTGKLPEADLAFLDEVFKASSAILNTLSDPVPSEATIPRPSPRCSGACAPTRPCEGSAGWRVASVAWRSRGSGGRRATVTTTSSE